MNNKLSREVQDDLSQYEDQLPEDMPQADYDRWFAASCVVDGVRMGPRYPFAGVQDVDRCVKCGHNKETLTTNGVCHYFYDNNIRRNYCICKCVFPSLLVSEAEDKNSVSAGKEHRAVLRTESKATSELDASPSLELQAERLIGDLEYGCAHLSVHQLDVPTPAKKERRNE